MSISESQVGVKNNSSNDVKIVYKWLKQFEFSKLTESDFYDYWKNWVPYILIISSGCNFMKFNEGLEGTFLFESLEEFICGGQNVQLLELLKSMYPPSKCGRVFKIGDPTYNCRECEMNNTCVLCADCFMKSSHKNHKYKLGTSYGNGFCDCGDLEAWKQDVYCTTHEMGLNHNNMFVEFMPNDMKRRVYLVFEYVLHYARVFLTLKHIPLSIDLNVDGILIDDFYKLDIKRDDYYCVIFENKEDLSFDQLLRTFTNSMGYSQEISIELIAYIERDGRAIGSYAKLEECNELKEKIEKCTMAYCGKHLNTNIVHSHVIAHQLYSLSLLTWMQNLIQCSELRAVFSSIIINSTSSNCCILEYILRKDNIMWKLARINWHKLLISGILIEEKGRIHFANIFSNNYKLIMTNLIDNDHGHIYSIVSLGVQIFTIPSIAKHLIVNHNVLKSILMVFIEQCLEKLNLQRKINFGNLNCFMKFKKAQIVFGDITTLLSCVPDAWTSELRKSFCIGVSLVIKILNYMQNVNSVTRQVNMILEYDMEWEIIFNLCIKLRPLLTKILLWCGSDATVLKQVYKKTLKKILKYNDDHREKIFKKFIGYEVKCVDYDVSCKSVSIHMPLIRFFAGLQLHVEHSGLSTSDIWKSPKMIMEHVLRVLVLKAQVLAGMWKFNGCSILNQLYLYTDIKCRLEMFDKDIVALQISASLIDSNHFLIYVLNKFNLLEWANTNFESDTLDNLDTELVTQTVILAEEFLTLIINIIGERYTPNIGIVTSDDCLKKEIIQLLCIEPMSHSELYKRLSYTDDIDKCFDKIINQVAVFNTTRGKNVYDLKPLFYNDYNVFFFHYSREERSKSEEQQRNQRKNIGELDCCPPPSLPPFNNAYSKISNIMISNVMFHIMQLILDRALNSECKIFSEAQLHRVLHLIGYALYEEERYQSPLFKFTENSDRYDIEFKLDKLRHNPRIDVQKDLLLWTLNKFRQVSSTRKNSEIKIEIEVVEDKSIEFEKQKKAKLAAERRALLMNQMAEMQKQFMKNNDALFDQMSTHSEVFQRSSEDNLGNIDNPTKIPTDSLDNKYFTCILCQEEQLVTYGSKEMVLAAYVQKSTVLCQLKSNSVNNNSMFHSYIIPLHFDISPHISTCGHAMHVDCWQNHFDNIQDRENRRVYRLRHALSFDVKKNEYLCPLCSGLCNTILPLLPSTDTAVTQLHISCGKWFEKLLHTLELIREANFKATIVSQVENVEGDQQTSIRRDFLSDQIFIRDETVYKNNEISQKLTNTILNFALNIYSTGTGLDHIRTNNNMSPLMTWRACAYIIHCNEVTLRFENKPLFGQLSYRQMQCMESLVRISAYLSSTWAKKYEINEHAQRILSIVIDNGGNNSIGILDWDAFGMLVSLYMTLPRFSTNGTMLDLNIFHLMLVVNLIQIILTIDIEENYMDVTDINSENLKDTQCLIDLVYRLRGIYIKNSVAVWDKIKSCSIPFLRCCTLFYHFLTGVPESNVLKEVNGDTYYNMCYYMGLPTTYTQLLNERYIDSLINKWAKNDKLVKIKQGQQIFKNWTHINELVKLPNEYCVLMNNVSKHICPKKKKESETPAMCLVCGQIFCFQSYCCQIGFNDTVIGACSAHVNTCGAGIGMFLRISECDIILLATLNKGSYMMSPYLDEFGQIDPGLKRGNPLFLDKDQYRKLQLLWLGHGLHKEISSYLEAQHNSLQNDWQHM